MKRMKSYLMFFVSLVLISSCAPKTAPAVTANNSSDSSGIRVLCYNIHHANPPSKPDFIDIQAIADVIKDQNPDLVALQEVDVFTERSGKSLHEAEELARLTGMKAYFAKAINHQGGEYGVAILSKYPMSRQKTHALPTVEGTNGEPRVLATAEINLPGNKKLLFACTHLDAQKNDTNRLVQIREIINLLNDEKLPVIIAGDFNAVPDSKVIGIADEKFKRTCTGSNCPFTIPVINPRKTIDYIAFSPANSFDIISHRVIGSAFYPSDHLPVFSILRLK